MWQYFEPTPRLLPNNWVQSSQYYNNFFVRPGGSYAIHELSLQDLYTESLIFRNKWSASNSDYDVVKYRGTTWTFKQHNSWAYMVHWEEAIIDYIAEELFLHPSIMYTMPRTRIVLPREQTGKRTKQVRVFIKPPVRYEDRWLFQRDLTNEAIMKFYVTLINTWDYWGFNDSSDWWVTFQYYVKYQSADLNWVGGDKGKAEPIRYRALFDYGRGLTMKNGLYVIYDNYESLPHPLINKPDNETNGWLNYSELSWALQQRISSSVGQKGMTQAWLSTTFKDHMVPWSEGLPLWLSLYALDPLRYPPQRDNTYMILLCTYNSNGGVPVILWLRHVGQYPVLNQKIWDWCPDNKRIIREGPFVPHNPGYNISLLATYSAKFTFGGDILSEGDPLTNPLLQPPGGSSRTIGSGLHSKGADPRNTDYAHYPFDYDSGGLVRSSALTRVSEIPPELQIGPPGCRRRRETVSGPVGSKRPRLDLDSSEDSYSSAQEEGPARSEGSGSEGEEDQETEEDRARERRALQSLQRKQRRIQQYLRKLRERLRATPPPIVHLPQQVLAPEAVGLKHQVLRLMHKNEYE